MDPTALLAAAAALAPVLVGAGLGGLLPTDARLAGRAARSGALLGLGLSVAAAIRFHGLGGSGSSSAAASLWVSPGGVGVRFDGLTSIVLPTVALIAAVVTRYATRYLDGDPRQIAFLHRLSFTTSAVMALVVANDWIVLWLGWAATGLGLQSLLTHFSSRPGALDAARRQRRSGRLGEWALLAAGALAWTRLGTVGLDETFARLASLGPGDPTGAIIAGLIVLAALTQSVQLPFHTWLPDSMETPTPVSALMHAGIVNAGGFLLIRTSPILAEAAVASAVLLGVGTLTAVYGSVVMLTQSDIKRKYAYSTVAQMGFMVLQCGLGAYAAATLHLVGHSLYKGYGFLSAAASVDPRAGRVRPNPARPAGPVAVVVALGAAGAIVAAAVLGAGLDWGAKAGLPVLAGILTLAIAQVLLCSRRAGPRPAALLAQGVLAGAAMAGAYFGGLALLDGLLGAAIPGAAGAASPFDRPLVAAAILAPFVAAFLLQVRVARGDLGPRLRTAFVHARHGFYLAALEERLTARFVPHRRPSAAHPENPTS